MTSGSCAGGGLGVRRVELAGGLVDVEGAGEGDRGVGARPQPGQPGEHHVDLQLRARRARARGRRRSARPARVGATPQTTWPASTACSVPSSSVQCTVTPSARGSSAVTVARVTSSAPAPPGRGRQRAGDRAHAADRHPPLAGAVADQVVEEAAAGEPVGGVHVGERADQAVGEGDAADDVVGEVVGDDVGERPLAQVVPEPGVAQPAGHVVGGRAAAR